MRGLLAFGLAWLVCGCIVSPADPSGAACDANHGCPTGEQCVAGFCAVPSSQQVDGGDMRGCVSWSQALDGFAPQTRAGTGASITVDSAQSNRLVAHTSNSASGSDFAVASVARERLFNGVEGQVAGTVFAPGTARNDGRAVFLSLRGTAGAVLELSFDNGWALGAFTGASVLQDQALDRPRSNNRYDPGTEHSFKVAWRAGAFRRVWVDGNLVFDDALTAFSGVGARPTQLELGILSSNNGQNPLDLTLSDWRLCNSADSAF